MVYILLIVMFEPMLIRASHRGNTEVEPHMLFCTLFTFILIIIMDISMAHGPQQDLGHNAPYKKLQKNV